VRAADVAGLEQSYDLTALLDWRTHPQLRDAAHGALRTDFNLDALPRWARAMLATFKRWEPTPEVRLEIRIAGDDEDVVVTVAGGPDGTTVENRADGEDHQRGVLFLRGQVADLVQECLGVVEGGFRWVAHLPLHLLKKRDQVRV